MEESKPTVSRSCLYCKERVPPDAYFCCYCGARLPYIPKPEETPVVKQIEKPVEDNKPGTYAPKELAKYLNTSVSAVYKLLKEGELKSVRIGSRFIIPRSSVEEWLKEASSRKYY